MASQFVILEDTGTDRDHLRAYEFSGTDIFRRITHEANGGILAESAPRLGYALAKDVHSQFGMIAKTTKAEELPQTSGSHFVPAYRFQISRSHAQQFSRGL